MTQAPDAKPKPLVISRVFPARRELVFKAWSTAEHMKRWFSPETYTIPDAEIDFRPGVCAICMPLSRRRDFWSRGVYPRYPHRTGWCSNSGSRSVGR